MSVSDSLPLKRALTGPIAIVIRMSYELVPLAVMLSQPGTHSFSTSLSFSSAQAVARSAGSCRSPFNSIGSAPVSSWARRVSGAQGTRQLLERVDVVHRQQAIDV